MICGVGQVFGELAFNSDYLSSNPSEVNNFKSKKIEKKENKRNRGRFNKCS